jgi:hypothetical protein
VSGNCAHGGEDARVADAARLELPGDHALAALRCPLLAHASAHASHSRHGTIALQHLAGKRDTSSVRLGLLVLLLLCAPGCVIGRYEEGLPVAVDRIPDIVPGKTTKAEILEWFGAPSGLADAQLLESFLADRELMPGPVVDLPFADVLVYRLTRGRLEGLVLILWNRVDFHVTNDTLVVFFDADDRVSSYGFRKGTDALR